MARRAPGEGSVSEGADGLWHAYVDFGERANGKRDRRHRQAKTRAELNRKLKKLMDDQAGGVVAGKPLTVGAWLTMWLEAGKSTWKFQTWKSYDSKVRCYGIPLLGRIRLDKLTTEQVEAAYRQMATTGRKRKHKGGDGTGLSIGTVRHFHRTMHAAMEEAVARHHVARNVVEHAKPERMITAEVDPLKRPEAKAVLDAAAKQRNAPRWLLALTRGVRQGEALGLQWDDVDLEAVDEQGNPEPTVRIRRALYRGRWEHGCGDPEHCGTGQARGCPLRHGGGLLTDDPKSELAKRPIPLPDGMVSALKAHRRAQAAERLRAGSLWQSGPGGGWVFASELGKPLDPSKDSAAWHALLDEAGVRDARLHDARHSAATFMLAVGMDSRSVMALLGWSQMSMLARYQHPVSEVQRAGARRVDDYLASEA